MNKPNFQLVGIGEPVEKISDGTQSSGTADPFTQSQFHGISGRRIAAYVFDLVLLGIASPVLFFGFKVIGILTFGLLTPLLLLVWSLSAIIYHTLFIASPWSATPGMRLLGVEVRAWNGNRPSLAQAALQTVLFYITVPTTSCLVLVFALFNDRRRCLHDYLCGTVVIRSDPVT
jgi:uncharacterized RDD family membrane protein YckC